MKKKKSLAKFLTQWAQFKQEKKNKEKKNLKKIALFFSDICIVTINTYESYISAWSPRYMF